MIRRARLRGTLVILMGLTPVILATREAEIKRVMV
jgi:hypothetical protein